MNTKHLSFFYERNKCVGWVFQLNLTTFKQLPVILHGSGFCHDSDTKDNSPKIIYELIKLDLKFVFFGVKFVFNCTLIFCSLF